ncbi:cysteine-rich KTR domain-containing protein [Gemella morbillorum]
MKLRKDIELKNFPLYCPKCKLETLVNIKEIKIIIFKEPEQRSKADNVRYKILYCRFLFYRKIAMKKYIVSPFFTAIIYKCGTSYI